MDKTRTSLCKAKNNGGGLRPTITTWEVWHGSMMSIGNTTLKGAQELYIYIYKLEWKIGHHFQKASKTIKSSIIIWSTTIPTKVAYLALRTCISMMQATWKAIVLKRTCWQLKFQSEILNHEYFPMNALTCCHD
jgi:hypothetical protein